MGSPAFLGPRLSQDKVLDHSHGLAHGSHGLKNLLASGKTMDLWVPFPDFELVDDTQRCPSLPDEASWVSLCSSSLLPSAFGASGV